MLKVFITIGLEIVMRIAGYKGRF